MPKFIRPYYLILILTSAWCLLVISPAIVGDSNPFSQTYNNASYTFFGKVCHQYDSRSLHIDGQKFTVCARCSGIYFGFLVGLLSLSLIFKNINIKYPVLFLFTISLPMLLDISLNYLGIHSSNLFTRTSSGLVFGILSTLIIYPTYQQALNELFNKHLRGKIYVRKT
ncbi:MAG: DUF2085 domain-containing protein [Bacteroidota bacterium]|nr:DUF2085 domain-containing protein [Bacteroidota bacterium]